MTRKGKERASNDGPKPKIVKKARESKMHADNFRMATGAVAQFNRGKPMDQRVELQHDELYGFFEKWQSQNSAEEAAYHQQHSTIKVEYEEDCPLMIDFYDLSDQIQFDSIFSPYRVVFAI